MCLRVTLEVGFEWQLGNQPERPLSGVITIFKQRCCRINGSHLTIIITKRGSYGRVTLEFLTKVGSTRFTCARHGGVICIYMKPKQSRVFSVDSLESSNEF
ncbi:hypothetical protein TNCT_569031 [Trichonephila clavata]|uniref:Uncharacterized protein n=1 Tax=Trichonephila clavata TaxID=2740835 RepID=A0A8X6GEA2_TRICU|nr:hypothetical protein TNCT_569031 [Trichonephila clavata]